VDFVIKTIILIILSGPVFAHGPEFNIDYDYANQGDDWYGQSRNIEPRYDHFEEVVIPTQQGDDYCLGYQARSHAFQQGPELNRSLSSRTAYAFYYYGGTRCLLNTPAPDDLIFADGFE